MTTNRRFPSGAYEVYATIGNEFHSKTYYGYTKREAQTLFRAEFMPKRKKLAKKA